MCSAVKRDAGGTGGLYAVLVKDSVKDGRVWGPVEAAETNLPRPALRTDSGEVDDGSWA